MQLIRRSLVMMGYLVRLGTKNTYKAKFEALSAALDNAPSVDAEPVRHGRWIKKIECAKCSICFEDCWADCAPSYEFCPRCGAKMDGGDGK